MRFGLLGLLQAEDGAGNVLPVAGPCRRLLLAALLVRVNRVVPARELAEIVWDGVPPAAAAALRTQVMRLRRALGPDAAARIIARDPGYVITLSAGELDVTLFEGLHQQAGAVMRAGRWAEALRVLDSALALWRGAALLDVESQALRDECGEHAAGNFEQALTMSRGGGDRVVEAEALNGLGGVLLHTGEAGKARVHHAAALRLASEADAPLEQAHAHSGLARACEADGDSLQARHHWREALTGYVAIGAPEAGEIRDRLAVTGS